MVLKSVLTITGKSILKLYSHPGHTGSIFFSLYAFLLLSHILQIHEKEEEEMNEKNDNANCLNEEPLITADKVCVYNQTATCLCLVFKCSEVEARGNMRLTL